MSTTVHRSNSLQACIILIALITLAVVPFIQTRSHDFINFDDNVYLTENHVIQQGFTWEGVKWSFLTVQGGYLHPVTWFSHMLDCQLFRQDDGTQWAGGHHLHSMILHAINTVLVWLVLWRMTGATWRSALVAGLFAAHPMHVESVAWAAERKDVLSGMFALLTILTYTNYARHGGKGRYLIVLGCFLLGLLSKPMLVTMPCLLLLLDVWPLRRVNILGCGALMESAPTSSHGRKPRFPYQGWGKALLEKVPMLLCSALISLYAVIAQYKTNAMIPMETMGFPARVANVVVAYASYIDKLVVPINLAVFYPYHGGWGTMRVASSAALLLTITAIVFVMRQRRPWLIVGWCWFVGMLVPVIGFVQVGLQAMADRYTYLPAIGLFIMAVWSIPAATTKASRGAWAVLSCAILVILCITSTVQASHWRNSRTVFDRAQRVTKGNFRALQNLGNAIERDAQLVANDPAEKTRLLDTALGHYLRAVEIRPDFSQVRENIANVLIQKGRYLEALEQLDRSIHEDPDEFSAHNSRGVVMLSLGRVDEAERSFRRAVELDPENLESRGNHGLSLLQLQQFDEAIAELSMVKARHPDRVFVRLNLARALAGAARVDEAKAELVDVLRVKPDFVPAQQALNQLASSSNEIKKPATQPAAGP